MSVPETLREVMPPHLRLEALVGEGGYAAVYRARDTKLDRAVAIKILRPDVASPSVRRRFLREGRSVATIRHPHVLPVYDLGEHGEFAWMVMPLVVGESLRARLDREGRLTLEETRRVLIAVADALGTAHALGIIHRDVKPENIMFDGTERHVFLVDFGVAAATGASDDSRDSSITMEGMAVGTPRYMSPEQLTPGSPLDGRTDLYALGILAYECLAGSPPFTAEKLGALLVQHLTEQPEPIAVRVPECGPYFASIVDRCLEKDPTRRWPSADVLVEEMKREERGSLPEMRYSQATVAPSPLEPMPARVVAPERWWMFTGVGLFVAAVATDLVRHEMLLTPVSALAGLLVVGMAIATRRVEGMRDRALAARSSGPAGAGTPTGVLDTDALIQRARALRLAGVSAFGALPRAMHTTIGAADAALTRVAFEADSAYERAAGRDAETARLARAQLLGAVAELEAMVRGLQRLLRPDAPADAPGRMRALVEEHSGERRVGTTR